MPPKGFKTVTLKEKLLERLEPVAEAKGFKSVTALISYVLNKYLDETKGIHHFD